MGIGCGPDGGAAGAAGGGGDAASASSASSAGGGGGASSSSAGGGGAGTGGDPGCAGDCVAVPTGWQGPVHFHSGFMSLPVDCDPTEEEVYLGFTNLQAPGSTECPTCACDDSAITCGDITVKLYLDPAACASECASVTLSQNQCAALPQGCNGAAKRFQYSPQPGYVSGSCTPKAGGQAPVIPPAEWQQSVRACKPKQLGAGCEAAGAVCVPPAPASLGTCVFAPGNLACPEELPVKALLWESYEDTRACSQCACGAPKDPCWLSVRVTDNACFNPGTESLGPDANKCFGLGAGAQEAAYFEPSGSCDPSGGEPVGELTPTTPTTLCCLKP